MSQTFPNDFKISNIDTGTESGTWGTITNANLNQMVRATGGFKQINISNTNSHTLTAPADNTSNQDFRNHFLEFTGTSTGAFTLTLPAIEKEYVIKNSLQHDMSIKTSTQSNNLINVPVGKTSSVQLNGSTAFATINTLDSLTLNTQLAVSSGGTGLTSADAGSVMVMNTAGTAFLAVSAGTSGNVLTSSGGRFISAPFQSAALTGVVKTNVGGYAENSSIPTIANGGSQSLISPLVQKDTGYSGYGSAGEFSVGEEGNSIFGFFNQSSTSYDYVGITVRNPGYTSTSALGRSNSSTMYVARRVGTNDLRNTFWKILEPIQSNSIDLGSTSDPWRDIYSSNSVTVTSDRRYKNTITDCDLGLDFINSLQPRKYKYNNGGSVQTVDEEVFEERAGVRFHTGLIAQEVEQTLYNLNIDKSTFAGWCLENSGDSNSTQLLRYEEFIAPMIKAIQELSNKVNILEAKIQQLESE